MNDNIYVVDYMNDNYLLIFLQDSPEFLTSEKLLMKEMIEKYVIPKVNGDTRSWDCKKMWQYVHRQYNIEAKKADFQNDDRLLHEVLSIEMSIYW